jgi:hypothetical protein
MNTFAAVFNLPKLRQREFCSATKIDMAIMNDLVSRDLIEVDETEGWHVKGGRRFGFLTGWRARMLRDLVEDHKLPLSRAVKVSKLAERLATRGGHLQHWATGLAADKTFIPAFLLVVWSGNTYDGQIITGDDKGLPDFSSAKHVPERFFKRPFLMVPISEIFADVWEGWAELAASEKESAKGHSSPKSTPSAKNR